MCSVNSVSRITFSSHSYTSSTTAASECFQHVKKCDQCSCPQRGLWNGTSLTLGPRVTSCYKSVFNFSPVFVLQMQDGRAGILQGLDALTMNKHWCREWILPCKQRGSAPWRTWWYTSWTNTHVWNTRGMALDSHTLLSGDQIPG